MVLPLIFTWKREGTDFLLTIIFYVNTSLLHFRIPLLRRLISRTLKRSSFPLPLNNCSNDFAVTTPNKSLQEIIP